MKKLQQKLKELRCPAGAHPSDTIRAWPVRAGNR